MRLETHETLTRRQVEEPMRSLAIAVAAGLALSAFSAAAQQISDDVVKIGVLTDMGMPKGPARARWPPCRWRSPITAAR